MNPRMLLGFVSFSVFMTGIFLANMFVFMMIGEINRKRPDGNLVSYFGFPPFKVLRIFREYRQTYPAGNTHIYLLVASALAIIGILGVGVCMRILTW